MRPLEIEVQVVGLKSQRAAVFDQLVESAQEIVEVLAAEFAAGRAALDFGRAVCRDGLAAGFARDLPALDGELIVKPFEAFFERVRGLAEEAERKPDFALD